MWTPVYYVRQIPLPAAVEGLTVPNEDGSFDIYLNESLCPERMKICLEHEIKHIVQDHFYQESKSVAQLEQEADLQPPRIPNILFDRPPGMIPVFASLDAAKHYLVAMSERREAC